MRRTLVSEYSGSWALTTPILAHYGAIEPSIIAQTLIREYSGPSALAAPRLAFGLIPNRPNPKEVNVTPTFALGALKGFSGAEHGGRRLRSHWV